MGSGYDWRTCVHDLMRIQALQWRSFATGDYDVAFLFAYVHVRPFSPIEFIARAAMLACFCSLLTLFNSPFTI